MCLVKFVINHRRLKRDLSIIVCFTDKLILSGIYDFGESKVCINAVTDLWNRVCYSEFSCDYYHKNRNFIKLSNKYSSRMYFIN